MFLAFIKNLFLIGQTENLQVIKSLMLDVFKRFREQNLMYWNWQVLMMCCPVHTNITLWDIVSEPIYDFLAHIQAYQTVRNVELEARQWISFLDCLSLSQKGHVKQVFTLVRIAEIFANQIILRFVSFTDFRYGVYDTIFI